MVVSNGHHWTRKPAYPGEFTGKQIFGKRYMRPSDLEDERVLVVGSGNTACDIAVETARRAAPPRSRCAAATGSSPRRCSGSPPRSSTKRWFPVCLQKRSIAEMRPCCGSGRKRYGLPKPDYRPFDKHPIVN